MATLQADNYLNFNNYQVFNYDPSQIHNSTLSISEDGTSLTIVGNDWKSINLPYTITADTILEFDFKSTAKGEIQGIGLDKDNYLSQNRIFNLYGTQNWGLKNFKNYAETAGEWKTYQIPVGKFYTEQASRLVFANDHDVSNPSAQSVFANVRIYENNAPLAVDDKGVTPINAPLTLKATQLLANDSDTDGDSLSLSSVKALQGGKVVINNQGNVVFTPNTDFKGQASFEYTINDGKGGVDTAKVNITVKTADIGMNLSSVNYHSSELPFLDLFKSSSGWFTQTSTSWNTGEQNSLVLDKNGWVKSLKGTGTSQKFDSVATFINKDIQGHYDGGKYVVLYDGKGTLEYGSDAKKDIAASTPGRDVINVQPSNAGIQVKITSTDPNNTGNYLRNIHIVPEAYESTYSEQIFNPTFIEKIDPFNTLRFMDWMDTNNNTQRQWSDRPTLNTARWNGGVPVEVMVELANTVDANPWFNIPHMATDQYVTNFAKYVKDHLDPELEVYVEYSNEVWNTSFAARSYVENLSDSLTVDQSYGQRTNQVLDIWDNVFGSSKDRVIGIIAPAMYSDFAIAQTLKYTDDSIDLMGIVGYIGAAVAELEQNKQEILGWTQEPDGGLNSLFTELTSGGVLTNGRPNGSLPEAWLSRARYEAIRDKYNIPFVAYEGGPALRPLGSMQYNTAINNLYTQANRDPRMGELYDKLLTQWFQVYQGDLFMHFHSAQMPSSSGYFGALEYIDQPSSPKYDALVDFIAQHSA